jgi:hypothetical protein
MVKRKATAILESLKEEPVQEPSPPPSESSVQPQLTIPPPPVEEPKVVVVPQEPKRVPKRKASEDPDLLKFQRKLEEREARLEMRLENMIQRKFMEVKDLAKPVTNYKPKQAAAIHRIQPRPEPRYEPRYESSRHAYNDNDEYEGYATQEEYDEEPEIPSKSVLFNKIFGC